MHKQKKTHTLPHTQTHTHTQAYFSISFNFVLPFTTVLVVSIFYTKLFHTPTYLFSARMHGDLSHVF